jgi:3-oxoacyl-[acyl-carrier protein] reductase
MSSQNSNLACPLQGRVAIVTGASRGIGAGIAIELARRGANVSHELLATIQPRLTVGQITLVYTSSRSAELTAKIASDIKALKNGSDARIVQADLSQVDAPEKIVAATLEAFGGSIDILVNNAGVLSAKAITETTAEDFAFIFDVNVRAPLLMAKAVVPYLRAPGRIINMSSVGGRMGTPQFAMYSASKGAIEGMTRSLAHELGHAGHTVNAVAPGPTKSEMLDNVPKDVVALQLKTTAVEHRVGTVDDIARIVAWLASEDARWVSGQTISASGGFLMI